MKKLFLSVVLVLVGSFAQADAVYTACINENESDVAIGNWSSELYYYAHLLGKTSVKQENGNVYISTDRIYTTRTYETPEEAYQDYRRALRSYVAQGFCPAAALN